MRKIISFITIISLLLGIGINTIGAGAVGKISVKINGTSTKLSVPVFSANKTYYVAAKDVVKSLGGSYTTTTTSVKIKLLNKSATIINGSKFSFVGGKPKVLTAPTIIKNKILYLPCNLFPLFGVTYSFKNNVISLTSIKAKPTPTPTPTPIPGPVSYNKIRYNGEIVNLTGVKPFKDKGILYLPMKDVSTALQLSVDERAYGLVISRDTLSITLYNVGAAYDVNGEQKKLKYSPILREDSLMVSAEDITALFNVYIDTADNYFTVNMYTSTVFSLADIKRLRSYPCSATNRNPDDVTVADSQEHYLNKKFYVSGTSAEIVNGDIEVAKKFISSIYTVDYRDLLDTQKSTVWTNRLAETSFQSTVDFMKKYALDNTLVMEAYFLTDISTFCYTGLPTASGVLIYRYLEPTNKKALLNNEKLNTWYQQDICVRLESDTKRHIMVYSSMWPLSIPSEYKGGVVK